MRVRGIASFGKQARIFSSCGCVFAHPLRDGAPGITLKACQASTASLHGQAVGLPCISSATEGSQRCHWHLAKARLAQSAERKALNLVVVGSSPTVGVFGRGCFPGVPPEIANCDKQNEHGCSALPSTHHGAHEILKWTKMQGSEIGLKFQLKNRLVSGGKAKDPAIILIAVRPFVVHQSLQLQLDWNPGGNYIQHHHCDFAGIATERHFEKRSLGGSNSRP